MSLPEQGEYDFKRNLSYLCATVFILMLIHKQHRNIFERCLPFHGCRCKRESSALFGLGRPQQRPEGKKLNSGDESGCCRAVKNKHYWTFFYRPLVINDCSLRNNVIFKENVFGFWNIYHDIKFMTPRHTIINNWFMFRLFVISKYQNVPVTVALDTFVYKIRRMLHIRMNTLLCRVCGGIHY